MTEQKMQRYTYGGYVSNEDTLANYPRPQQHEELLNWIKSPQKADFAAPLFLKGKDLELLHSSLQIILPAIKDMLPQIPDSLVLDRIAAMAINAFCSDSELLLPKLMPLPDGSLERPETLQALCEKFRNEPTIYKALINLTALKLWSELFPQGEPIYPINKTEEQLAYEAKWGTFSYDTPRTVFPDMGEPAIPITCAQSTNGDFESLHIKLRTTFLSVVNRPGNIRHIHEADLQEVIVPGAGLNGLRILPEIHRLNAYTKYEDENWPVFDDHWGNKYHGSKKIHFNDLNPFVAGVWECLEQLGKFSQGLANISFTHGDLGGQKFLDKLSSPTALVLSNVQAAGPAALIKLIETAAIKHTESKHPKELNVAFVMQDQRSEPGDATSRDLAEALNKLGFFQVVDSSQKAFRKLPTRGNREADFTELTVEEFTALQDGSKLPTTALSLSTQVWVKAGTKGFTTVWTRSRGGGIS